MASTSFSLGPYWDDFIKAQVAEGRYGSASEVVREALRRMEEEHKKFLALQAQLQVGLDDIAAGRVVSADEVFAELHTRVDAAK